MTRYWFLYTTSFGIEWLVLCLLIALFLFPRYLVGLITALVFVRLDERFPMAFSTLGMAYGFLIACVAIHFRSFLRHRFERDDKILFLFIGVILVETFLFNRGELPTILKDIGLGLVYYISVLVFLKGRKGLKILNYVLVVSTTLVCLEPLYYHLTEPVGSRVLYSFVGLETRLAAWGMWNNANETAFLALLGIANILILLTIDGFRFKRMLLYSPLLVMFLVVTVMTASRTGIACTLILLLFGGLFAKRQALRIGAIALLVVGVVMAPTYLAMRTDMEGSSEARDDLRYIGKEIFLQNPVFGVGFGEARYGHGTNGQPIHNAYLQAFAETGFVGGGLLLLFFYMNGLKLVRRLRASKGAKDVVMLNGILAGFFVSSCLYFFFGNQLLTIMFFTIFAVMKITLSAASSAEPGAQLVDGRTVQEPQRSLSIP